MVGVSLLNVGGIMELCGYIGSGHDRAYYGQAVTYLAVTVTISADSIGRTN